MRIEELDGPQGAAAARGVAVIVDVLRAFTVSAYALAAGAVECRLVTTVEEALRLQRATPGSVVSAEVEGLPVPGIEISNSPTQVRAADLEGRVLIQRSSDGTRGVAAAGLAQAVYACSLVVVTATARALLARRPPLVTLVAMGTPRGHVEDRLCTAHLRRLLCGAEPDPATVRQEWAASQRSRLLAAGTVPGFPAGDVDLALDIDRFQFAMPVDRRDGLRLRGEPQGSR